jgi:hypothetical protein
MINDDTNDIEISKKHVAKKEKNRKDHHRRKGNARYQQQQKEKGLRHRWGETHATKERVRTKQYNEYLKKLKKQRFERLRLGRRKYIEELNRKIENFGKTKDNEKLNSFGKTDNRGHWPLQIFGNISDDKFKAQEHLLEENIQKLNKKYEGRYITNAQAITEVFKTAKIHFIRRLLLGTFQGRPLHNTKYHSSSNACVVISSMISISHVTKGNLTCADIVNIIDEKAGVIVRNIRSQLEKPENSFLAMHEVESGLLKLPDWSRGYDIQTSDDEINCDLHGHVYFGGNISKTIDFIERKRINCALSIIFASHCITVLQTVSDCGALFYEFIDSLQNDRWNKRDWITVVNEAGGELIDQDQNTKGAERIYCKNKNAIKAILMKYAVTKVTPKRREMGASCTDTYQNDQSYEGYLFLPKITSAD